MAMIVKAKPSADFLYVRIDGDFSLDEATRTFGVVIDMVVANNSRRVLFDGRTIVGDPSPIQRFYYAAFASDSVNLLRANGWIQDPPRFAYVLHEPVLDPLRLGQIVAKKRGMNLKAFDNIDEAIRWLRLKPKDVKYMTAPQ
jgi:hypothetical protein